MTSRERIAAACAHAEPDRLAIDFGGGFQTGIHVSMVYALRQALGLDAPGTPVKVVEIYQMLGEIAPDLAAALSVDTVSLHGSGTMFGFPQVSFTKWRLADGTPVLVPVDFNTTCEAVRSMLPIVLLGAVVAVGLGLGSRGFGSQLPACVAAYAGDTLWALTLFLVLSAALPRARLWRRAAAALTLSYAVEVSQLSHPPWLEALRATRLGGFDLGFGFLWSDLVCYASGIAAGVASEYRGLGSRQTRPGIERADVERRSS
jgi:hypothetical protein